VVALKVTDIDSQRMTLRIEQGKGRKCSQEHLRPHVLAKLMLRRSSYVNAGGPFSPNENT
jgi:hypothetical protein